MTLSDYSVSRFTGFSHESVVVTRFKLRLKFNTFRLIERRGAYCYERRVIWKRTQQLVHPDVIRSRLTIRTSSFLASFSALSDFTIDFDRFTRVRKWIERRRGKKCNLRETKHLTVWRARTNTKNRTFPSPRPWPLNRNRKMDTRSSETVPSEWVGRKRNDNVTISEYKARARVRFSIRTS